MLASVSTYNNSHTSHFNHLEKYFSFLPFLYNLSHRLTELNVSKSFMTETQVLMTVSDFSGVFSRNHFLEESFTFQWDGLHFLSFDASVLMGDFKEIKCKHNIVCYVLGLIYTFITINLQ